MSKVPRAPWAVPPRARSPGHWSFPMLESHTKRREALYGSIAVAIAVACGGAPKLEGGPGAITEGGTAGTGQPGTGGAAPSGGGGSGASGGSGGTNIIPPGDGGSCPPLTCASLGWACGYTIDKCDNVV